MFKNNLVCAVKHNNKILREIDGAVFMPFQSEYSLLFKNLGETKCGIRIKIDGEFATGQKSIVLAANSEIEIKRFLDNDNLDVGNAFKFIEKTEKISSHRGDRIEDGIITIEFEWEDVKNISTIFQQYNQKPWRELPITPYNDRPWCSANIIPTNHMNYSSDVKLLDDKIYLNSASDGITVKGSLVEQSFKKAHFIGDGKLNKMSIKLFGVMHDGTPVSEPSIVKKNSKCHVCGSKIKQTDNFCSECGASLKIVK